jgi:hypothetical protein
MLRINNPKRIQIVAILLGVLGFYAWLTLIMNVGGFSAAYGAAYGGGWATSGYIREMRFVGLLGAILLFMVRSGRGMRITDWILIGICITPTLTHALLGARRGPLFLSVVILIGGYFYFMRKKVSLPVLIGLGVSLGLGMLFLVANRNNIHLGSDLAARGVTKPSDFLLRWESNEYLIGGAVIRYTDLNGSFYGIRELTWLIGRILPHSIWPTIWTDLPQLFGMHFNLFVNGGVSQEGLTTLSNWTPSVGSAEGFSAALYLEFGWLSPGAAYMIGIFYGKIWSAAKTGLAARVFYLLMAAISVYLVMQSLDPWLYRLMLFGLPAYFVLRTVKASPTDFEIREGGRLQETVAHRPSAKRPNSLERKSSET